MFYDHNIESRTNGVDAGQSATDCYHSGIREIPLDFDAGLN